MKMNKMMICTTAFLLSTSLMAATKAKEITHETATKIMATKNTAENKEHISGVAKSAAKGAELATNYAKNIEDALMQGNPDLLVMVSRLAEKEDTKGMRLVVELSAGVKSEADAKYLAQISEKGLDKIAGAKDFLEALNSEIEKGNSIVKAAEIAAEKTKKDKTITTAEWLKKLLDCV